MTVQFSFRKSDFYSLRRDFFRVAEREGVARALMVSYEVYRGLCDGGVHPNGTASAMDFARSAAAEMPADSMYRVAVNSFAQGNWPCAMAATISSVLCGAPAPPQINSIAPDSPSAGHPLWHLLNPYFHIWRDAPLTPGASPQDSWRESEAIAKTAPVPSEEEYSAWAKADDIERSRLCAFMRDAKPASLIDIGCGNGRLLRYAVDNFDGVFEFHGIDLHSNRATAAMELIQRSNRAHYSAATCAHDLLSPGPLPPAQLAILNRVAGCFDDDQLRIVIGKIADSGAHWIFEAEVLDTWDLWKGRRDPSELYAQAGWRLQSSEIIGDPLTPDGALYMILPNKYWIARAVRVWGRA